MISLSLSLFLGALMIAHAIERGSTSVAIVENEAGEIVVALTKGTTTIFAISEDGGRSWETTATHDSWPKGKKKKSGKK